MISAFAWQGRICATRFCVSYATCSTVTELYKTTVQKFIQHSISEPEESARYLLSHAANIEYRLSVFKSNGNRILNKQQLATLETCVHRRLAREPIQYIIGNWDFYGFEVKCRPPVLIPRPETEQLVDLILSNVKKEKLRILDIGCGSGVIGIALLTQLPHATCVSIDIDSTAVTLTRENVENVLCRDCSKAEAGTSPDGQWHCCRVAVQRSCVADFCSSQDVIGKFDLIVSNPPYIPSADLLGLAPEVRVFESPLALDGGRDGLDVVRQVLALTSGLLSARGTRELWMEVSHTHPEAIRHLLTDGYGLCGGGSVLEEGRGAEEVNPPDSVQMVEQKSQLEGQGISSGYGYEFVEGLQDGYGSPRFVRLRAL